MLELASDTAMSSRALGFVDVIYTWLYWLFTPSTHRFFTKGYGDIKSFRRLREWLIKAWIDGPENGRSGLLQNYTVPEMDWHPAGGGPPRDFIISPDGRAEYVVVGGGLVRECASFVEQEEEPPGDFTTHDATFKSPIARYLPKESGDVYVRLVVPTGPVKGIVIFTSATNDESYDMRQRALAEPLIEHGLASLLMIPPFYGLRRPWLQDQSKVRTVTEYMMQNIGVIVEGCAVVEWCREAFPAVPLGISGISWGGAMAACIAGMCNRPVACIPCLGSTCPGGMVTGSIRWQLDWKTLMEQNRVSKKEAQEMLEAEFRSVTLKTMMERALEAEPKKFRKGKILTLVQVQALHDHYVPRHEGKELYEVLSARAAEHRLVWLKGGHVSAFASAKRDFVPQIVAAMERSRRILLIA